MRGKTRKRKITQGYVCRYFESLWLERGKKKFYRGARAIALENKDFIAKQKYVSVKQQNVFSIVAFIYLFFFLFPENSNPYGWIW